jgi:acyl-CoA thioesterase-1
MTHLLRTALVITIATLLDATSLANTLGTTPNDPSLVPITDVPGLPRVLIIGDSISMGYTIPVRALLKDKANVHRIPQNGESTTVGLVKLRQWIGSTRWDVIHFNWGLHDLKHVRDNAFDLEAPVTTEVDQYKTNLANLVTSLKVTGARLIWASTTPVPENCPGRISGDEIIYNAAALPVMKDAHISVNDLHSRAMERLEAIQKPNDVHFNQTGNDYLAAQVASAIEAYLDSSKQQP